MRTLLLSVIFAGVLAMIAPAAWAGNPDDDAVAPVPVAVQRVSMPSTGMRDEATMVLVGTALIGLAAAVRRAA